MLPTFHFTEENAKHLLLFKFSDVRHGAAHFRAAPSLKAAGPCQSILLWTWERDQGVRLSGGDEHKVGRQRTRGLVGSLVGSCWSAALDYAGLSLISSPLRFFSS